MAWRRVALAYFDWQIASDRAYHAQCRRCGLMTEPELAALRRREARHVIARALLDSK